VDDIDKVLLPRVLYFSRSDNKQMDKIISDGGEVGFARQVLYHLSHASSPFFV
jgi:hypothetical protein